MLGGAKDVAVGVPRLEGVLTSPCWTCLMSEKMAIDSSYPAETSVAGSGSGGGGGRLLLESFSTRALSSSLLVLGFLVTVGNPEAMDKLRTDPS